MHFFPSIDIMWEEGTPVTFSPLTRCQMSAGLTGSLLLPPPPHPPHPRQDFLTCLHLQSDVLLYLNCKWMYRSFMSHNFWKVMCPVMMYRACDNSQHSLSTLNRISLHTNTTRDELKAIFSLAGNAVWLELNISRLFYCWERCVCGSHHAHDVMLDYGAVISYFLLSL